MAASRGSFKPGQSGNPGGRPSIAKALAECGTTPAKVTADVLKRLMDALETLDPAHKDEGASWRFCAEKLLAYTAGKPVEIVEQRSELTDEEIAEEIEIIAREKLRSMPLEERLRLVADPAPTDTIQ